MARVLLFGSLVDVAGWREREIDVPALSSLKAFLAWEEETLGAAIGAPGEAAVFFPNGGLLAAGPNLGRFSDDRFSVVPEVQLNLGYWLTPNLKAFVGYNALYWSNVVRPGDQIDRVVDVTFVPNPPTNPATGQVPAFSGQNRPVVPFRQDHLWVNGIQFGAEWRW